jgi:RNA polymerase sigma-70 factor (ECF subfamily)
LQQTWLQAFRGIRSLKRPSSLPAWLYQIARWQAASHWRDYYRDLAAREAPVELDQMTAPEEPPHGENAELVHHALARLSLAHREVLVLYFLEDLSLEEMATLLEVPLGTVKSRLWHARRALAAALKDEVGHD